MAKWSSVWQDSKFSSRGRKTMLIDFYRSTPPAAPKKCTGGQYPHLQPFFRNRQQEQKAA